MANRCTASLISTPRDFKNVRAQRGFVLVMTVGVVAVVSVFLASTASFSLDAAVQAKNKRDEVQRRWCQLSCERTILNRASLILQESAHSSGIPHKLDLDLVLGGTPVRLRVSDETAKLHVDSIARIVGKEERNRVLGGIVGSAITDRGIEHDISSWGNIIDYSTIDNSRGLQSIDDLTEKYTCWGNGKLNVRTAPDSVVRILAQELSLPGLTHMLKRFQSKSADNASLEEFLANQVIASDSRTHLSEILTNKSDCFSIRIRSEKRPSWNTLVVNEFSTSTNQKHRFWE